MNPRKVRRPDAGPGNPAEQAIFSAEDSRRKGLTFSGTAVQLNYDVA